MSNLKDMMEQVKKLKNGMGIQNLIDSAYMILGNPILIHDTEYVLTAYTDVENDDPIWAELIKNGTFSKETQQFFVTEGFVEEVANTPILSMLKSEKLKYDRMTGKIFNKNNTHVSNLVIVACNRPFEENDIMVIETICKLLSREISKNKFYQEYEQAHQETLIKNLIDGNYDVKSDVAQVEILYRSLGPNLFVAVADISKCNSETTNAIYFRNLLKQKKPAYKYAIYSDYVIIIISTNDDVLNVNNELKELVKLFEQNNIYVGLSSRFENLFELRKYYNEALKSLDYAMGNKSGQRIFPYNGSR